MPRSHICPQCGLELGFIPPTVEPYYGLPLVVCPRCGKQTVRIESQVRAMVRWWRRLAGAACYSALNGGALVVILGLQAGAIYGAFRELESYGIRPVRMLEGLARGEHREIGTEMQAWYEDRGQLWLVAMLCVSVLTGVAWMSILAHWRRVGFIVAWLALLHAAFAAPIAGTWVFNTLRTPASLTGYATPGVSPWFWSQCWQCWQLAWIGLPLTALGVPIGRAVVRMRTRLRRVAMGFYRSRIRRARDGRRMTTHLRTSPLSRPTA